MTAADVVARVGSLASLPATFHRVSDVIERPGSCADDIAEAMRADPSLAGRVLKLSNSAFFGYPNRVDNLRQAVVLIGTRQVVDLMTATIAVGRFAGISPELVDMADFWRHSFACGLAARALAQVRGETNLERFFIAGLLHDIGSLVLYQAEGERAARALRMHRESKIPLETAEREVFGFDHADVGEALLTAWRLPLSVRAAAGGHHRPLASSPHAGTVSVVHVADLLVHALALGTNGEARVPRLAAGAWADLGQPVSVLEGIGARVGAGLDAVEALFLGAA